MRVSSNATMTDAESKAFGSEMKRLREEAGFSGTAFSELMGVSESHISQLERGTKKPSPELAERIADAFNVTVSDMLKPHDERVQEIRRKIGASLRDKRREKGLAISTIAGALGVLPYVYEEYEKGLCSITDREMDILNKLLGVNEEPKVEVVEKVVEVPAEIPAEIYDIILKHIKDLQVDEATQRVVWRYFNKVRVDAEERRLFG
jgi:transcriptional regulator with XRE-family HTH domain